MPDSTGALVDYGKRCRAARLGDQPPQLGRATQAPTVTRFDGAARPTRAVQLPDGTQLLGCIGADATRVVIAARGLDDAAKVWEIDLGGQY